MKIFVLEDHHFRIMYFAQKFVHDDLTMCNDARTAMHILEKIKYDYIFLDHDLGGAVYVDSDCHNTGYLVACNLRRTVNAKTPVLIHSWNEVGATKMGLAIVESGGLLIGSYPYETEEFNQAVDALRRPDPIQPGISIAIPKDNIAEMFKKETEVE